MCVKNNSKGAETKVGGKGRNVPCVLFPTSHWACLAYHATGDVVRNGPCLDSLELQLPQRGAQILTLLTHTDTYTCIQMPQKCIWTLKTHLMYYLQCIRNMSRSLFILYIYYIYIIFCNTFKCSLSAHILITAIAFLPYSV